MKLVSLTVVAVTIALTTGCATVTEKATIATNAVKKTITGGSAIADANAKLAAVQKAGCSWTLTSGMIKKAEKLAAEGKTDEANALAEKATRQSEYGLSQCESEIARYKKTFAKSN